MRSRINFRRRGVPVIMGGPHTYFYPEERPRTATRSASARGRTSARDARRFRKTGACGNFTARPIAGTCRPAHAPLPAPRLFEIHRDKDVLRPVLTRLPIRVRVPFRAVLPMPPLPSPAGRGRRRRDQEQRGTLRPFRGEYFRRTAVPHKEAQGGTHPAAGTLVRPVARPPLQRPRN